MAPGTLAIFGISGQTGRAVAKAAVARSWTVRGFARPDGHTEGLEQPAVTIVGGEFAQPARVDEVIDGASAVCCVIGPRPPYTDVFCAEATAAILASMRRTGATRIVCQTGAMIGTAERTLPFEGLSRLMARRQPAMARDRVDQERLVMASGLAWTLVKPPRLTRACLARPVHADPALRMGLLSRIDRASLALFILDAIERERFIGERVFVRN